MTDGEIRIVGVLSEIRDMMRLVLSPDEVQAPNGCPHPEERRVSLATPSQPDHWVCSVCRYEHVA